MLRQAITISLLAFPALGYTQSVSRIEPPKEKLGVIVVDQGAGLDTGCSFRSEGPLVINVPIPAVVNENEINAGGKLKDPNKLIRNQVIGSKAHIIFPGWDVDDKATPNSSMNPEVDTITFNGKSYGVQKGLNNQWVLQQFDVNIQDLTFASSTNTLQIDIDTANVGKGEFWCTAVDWVAVEFDVAAPYVLAHGITGDITTWDEKNSPGVLQALDDRGVLYTRFSTGPNGSIIDNGRDLFNKIGDYLKQHKSDRIHAIAHSKGGLDIQAMVALMPKNGEFKVLSLSTLSTPHYGSVLADLSIIELVRMVYFNAISNNSLDPGGWVDAYLNRANWTAAIGAPTPPGLNDLQTRSADNAIKNGFAGNISPTYTIGADADLNRDGKLDGSEANGMPTGSEWAFAPAWRVLQDYDSARIVGVRERKVAGFTVWRTLIFETTTTPAARANDIAVTEFSASPFYGTSLGDVMANHAAVKSGANVRTILNRTVPMR